MYKYMSEYMRKSAGFDLFKNRKGSTIILFSMILTALMGFGAIAVDVGRVVIEKSLLQNAIDATVLSAAQDLPDTAKVTATANQYIQSNGFSPSDIAITFSDSDTTVNITASKNIDYTLARVLGFTSATVHPEASAVMQTGIDSDAFDYAVFAGGGPVSFNGSKHVFDGSIYGRDGVSLGNNAKVLHGSAVSSNGTCGPSDTTFGDGRIIVNHPVITMPDFSQLIKEQGIVCANQADFTSRFSGKSIDGPVYVNGDLTINGRIKGKGIVYASGTITISPSQTSSDSIFFYAGGAGGITVNGGTGSVYGIIYAPNGTIRVNGGSNGVVYGRMVARNIDVNGSKFSVYSNVDDVYTDLNDYYGLNTLTSIKLVK